ncbi:MAG: helix-turn-helix domain-containing protein [Polaromonas sp.]|nr:helix-turn-helix domain-containing protein [Polaromonas sp.]
MSELDGREPDEAAMPREEAVNQEPPQSAVTAGTLLRQARESAGLHIAALAVSLKVPVKKLEALEADRLDLLPDAVFVRALASSVCRTLKVDVTEVLALLPQTGKPRLDYQHASINTPFRSPSDGPGPSLWTQVSRPAVLCGLLLVLGALVLIFLPAVQTQDLAIRPASDPVAAAQPSGPVMPPAEARGEEKLLPADMPAPAATAPVAAVESATPAATPAPPPATAVAAAPPAVSAAAVAASAPAAAPGIILFSAKGESWVEVTDAKGTVVLRRTLAPGEAASASGVLPLAAVVGRVDATQVQVRGRAFDLSAVSKDNVARFEVK